jgi:photosystem II stability/assembly factor-like uncharacterized protein/predicted secreted protein
LIIDPDNPAIAYIGTWLAGTWKTVDAGATWTLLQDAPLSSTALSLNRQNTNIIYLADRSSPTVWRSLDAGSTWEKIGDFTSDGALLVMRVLADDSTVYASTFEPCLQGGRLYKSTNSGLDWTDITGTLPKGILDVAVDPTNSDVIYVTTNINGAHKSTDGGTTWNELEHFPDVGAYDIEVDPGDPTILYTSARGGSLPGWFTEIDGEPDGITFTDDAGVYKSTNSGENWNKILTTTASCRAIRRHPDDPDLLFAPDLVDGLQMSTDGGNNWTSCNTGLDNSVVTSCAVGGDKIYVGTQGCGVYSGDIDIVSGSITWQPNRSNKPVPEVYNMQIEVDPANSNNIFVASYPGGLYCSSDCGTTFRDKNAITPSVIVDYPFIQGYYTFAINPINSSRMWVGTWGKGIYKSYNAMSLNVPAVGTDYKMQGKHINQIAIDPNPPNDVYVATQEGVFMTCDDREHWQEMNDGLETLNVRSLKITNIEWPPFEDDFEDGNADEWNLEDGWLVIQENGNYVLQGIGHKWANAGSRDWIDYTFESKIKLIQGGVHVNSRVGPEGRYFLGFNEDGLYLKKQFNQWGEFDDLVDHEEHHNFDQWYDLKVEIEEGDIKIYVDGIMKIEYTDPDPLLNGAIAFETLDDSHVYVDDVYVTIDPIDSLVYAGTAGYGIYRLNPTDKKWQNLGRTLGDGWWSAWDRRMYQFSSILFDPDVPGKVYYGHFPSGFFISEDNGHTWNASNLGIGNDGMFSLSMHPYNRNILFAGTYNGVVKSVDGGKTWEMKSNGMPLEQWPYTVAIDDINLNIMYVSTKNGQNKGFCHRNEFCGVVMKSTDGGESWFKIMNGLDDKSEFYTLLIYPLDHNILFLSTSNGVYLSNDAGNSWEAINNGLPVTRNQVRDNVADNLALTPDNKNLILGLVNYGVWKADLSSFAPPEITSFVPPSPISDTENATRIFYITINQPVNVTWQINGTEVQTNASVTAASYTNMSAVNGTWNVSAIVTNANGTDMQTWVWNVSPSAPSKIIYPDFTDSDTPGSWRTWIGVMNTGDASTTLNLTIYNPDGSLAYSNPDFVTLEPKAAHFFRPGKTAGIAQGSTIVSGDNLAGTCHESKNDGDGAKVYTAVTSSSPTLYYPDFTDTDTIGNWRTWMGVVNAGDTSTTVRLDVYNPDGSLAYSNANFVTLEPKAAHFFRPGITAGIAQGCVVVSGANLAGTCHVNKNGGEGTKVYTALTSGSSTLYYPDFTDTDTIGNWRTWLGVMNTGDASTTLNLTIYNPDGSLAYSNANFITLEPKAAHFFRPGITAGIAQGDVVVSGDNLAGTCHVNKNGGEGTKVYTALSSGSSTLNYPDFTDTDTSGNWRTWMGVMNTGATSTTVRLDVYNADGSLAYSNANFVTLEPKAAHFFRPGITAGIAQGDVVVSGDNLAGTCHVNKNGGVGTKVYTAIGG